VMESFETGSRIFFYCSKVINIENNHSVGTGQGFPLIW